MGGALEAPRGGVGDVAARDTALRCQLSDVAATHLEALVVDRGRVFLVHCEHSLVRLHKHELQASGLSRVSVR